MGIKPGRRQGSVVGLAGSSNVGTNVLSIASMPVLIAAAFAQNVGMVTVTVHTNIDGDRLPRCSGDRQPGSRTSASGTLLLQSTPVVNNGFRWQRCRSCAAAAGAHEHCIACSSC